MLVAAVAQFGAAPIPPPLPPPGPGTDLTQKSQRRERLAAYGHFSWLCLSFAGINAVVAAFLGTVRTGETAAGRLRRHLFCQGSSRLGATQPVLACRARDAPLLGGCSG